LTKYCPECKTKLPDRANFCTNCGSKFELNVKSYSHQRQVQARKTTFKNIGILTIAIIVTIGVWIAFNVDLNNTATDNVTTNDFVGPWEVDIIELDEEEAGIYLSYTFYQNNSISYMLVDLNLAESFENWGTYEIEGDQLWYRFSGEYKIYYTYEFSGNNYISLYNLGESSEDMRLKRI